MTAILFLVIPVRNRIELLRDTLRSASQIDSESSIVLAVIDGMSTDGSDLLAIEYLSMWSRPQDRVAVLQGAPQGLYPAIRQAWWWGLSGRVQDEDNYQVVFQQGSCSVANKTWTTWLGAGDTILPKTANVLEMFAKQSSHQWVTGLRAYSNRKGIVFDARLPFRFTQKHLRQGMYGQVLPGIQQESTYWTMGLLKDVDSPRVRLV